MFTVPSLEYGYDSLTKAISKQIMELHHDKHHQAYVDKLNAAIEQAPELKDKSLTDLLTNLESVPETVRTTVRNQGGGHYNHTLFWKFMSPNGGGEPTGELADKLTEHYGNFEEFVAAFEAKAMGVFGSGWAWLMPDLTVTSTPNQDTPIMHGQQAPLLGLDVWEHAYYLDYTVKRADYIKAWWNVVNWEYVAQRYSGTDNTTFA